MKRAAAGMKVQRAGEQPGAGTGEHEIDAQRAAGPGRNTERGRLASQGSTVWQAVDPRRPVLLTHGEQSNGPTEEVP